MPEPLENPVLVAASWPCLVDLLGINFEETKRIGVCCLPLHYLLLSILALAFGVTDLVSKFTSPPPQDFAAFFSGSKLFEGADPHSHCYAGYQFGVFSGQLGDGAAMTMGQVLNKVAGLISELQFKGSGPTPYSRSLSICFYHRRNDE